MYWALRTLPCKTFYYFVNKYIIESITETKHTTDNMKEFLEQKDR